MGLLLLSAFSFQLSAFSQVVFTNENVLGYATVITHTNTGVMHLLLPAGSTISIGGTNLVRDGQTFNAAGATGVTYSAASGYAAAAAVASNVTQLVRTNLTVVTDASGLFTVYAPGLSNVTAAVALLATNQPGRVISLAALLTNRAIFQVTTNQVPAASETNSAHFIFDGTP
jgi:hypothetical protein